MTANSSNAASRTASARHPSPGCPESAPSIPREGPPWTSPRRSTPFTRVINPYNTIHVQILLHLLQLLVVSLDGLDQLVQLALREAVIPRQRVYHILRHHLLEAARSDVRDIWLGQRVEDLGFHLREVAHGSLDFELSVTKRSLRLHKRDSLSCPRYTWHATSEQDRQPFRTVAC